jgi:hypothetical protein
MVSEIKKRCKYDKSYHPNLYFELCSQGKTDTQIATLMQTEEETLESWAKNPKYYEWHAAWVRGRDARKAYHETILTNMMMGYAMDSQGKILYDESGHLVTKNYDSKSKELQLKRMERMFRDAWGDRQKTELEVSGLESLKDEDLDKRLNMQLKKILKIKPDLALVHPKSNDGTK